MLRKFIFLLLALQIASITAMASPYDRSGLDAKLHNKIHNYRLRANNLVEALIEVARDFQIPMGIEWVKTARARTTIDLSWKSATVREVLQAVLATQPGYRMQPAGQVLRIFPFALISDQNNPLKLKIRNFEVHDASLELASRELHELVRTAISPPTLRQGPGGIAGSGASNIDDPKISVHVENELLENVLDELALASARKIWIVTFSDNPGLTQTGFRRTLTLWNDFPIPDNQQPIWDFLHWQDPEPPLLATSNGSS